MVHQQKEVNQKMRKTKDKKMKYSKQSKLLIAYILGEGIDNFGRRFIHTKWMQAKAEISLGYFTKPNREIYLIKYFIPQK